MDNSFFTLMNLLPGMNQRDTNILIKAALEMQADKNTPCARGGNLISLPAYEDKQGGGDDESR